MSAAISRADDDPISFYAHLRRPAATPDAPTLLMLHGTGGDARSFAAFAAELAPAAGMLSLDGDLLEGPHRRFFRRKAEGVYDYADLAARLERLQRFLPAAFAAYEIDPATVIGLGYSNGANMLGALAFAGEAPIARWALMHPLLPQRPETAPSLAGHEILITAGRRDPISPAPATEALAADLASWGAEVTTAWSPGGHEVDAAELQALRRFVGA